MSTPDEELVNAAIDGDGEALAQLLRQHGPVVRRSLEGGIPKRWQSILSVDDVLQQTYTDAFLDVGTFVSRGEGAFRAWLVTLAKRNLLDAVKAMKAARRGGHRRRVEARSTEESVQVLVELLSDSGSTPSRHAATGEACTAMEVAITHLPPTYAQVVRMCDLEARPVEEVAQTVDRTVGAVYLLRIRAHDRLRTLMGRTSKYFSDGA